MKTYMVSFKKPTSGRLVNLYVFANNLISASKKASAFIRKDDKWKDYKEYGISKEARKEINWKVISAIIH